MSRRLAVCDRLAAFLLGLLLLAGGAALIAWQQEFIFPDTTLDTSELRAAVATDWYRWASAALGIALVLIALRWFIAHLRVQKMKEFSLAGSGDCGRHVVLPNSAADAAADALTRVPGIASVKGKAIIERGTPLVVLSATVTRSLLLADIANAAEETRAQVRAALDSPELPVRIELTSTARERDRARVK